MFISCKYNKIKDNERISSLIILLLKYSQLLGRHPEKNNIEVSVPKMRMWA